jgi:7-cyano-7-deazaguanine synthase
VEDLVSWKSPLEKTWSCYQSSGEACGKCDSCLLRLQAFEFIKQVDVIPYQKKG